MLVSPKLEARPFEVMKFRVGVPRRVLVLSPLLGLNTHYLGASKLCAGSACPACLAGISGKFAGYLCVLFEAQRRLIRLTQNAAHQGELGDQFRPGRVLEVVKERERRPLITTPIGDSKTFDRSAIISRVELLSVVARLHGLPRVPDGLGFDRAIEGVAAAALTACRLAMRGDHL